jgi:hypothetical protein
MPSRKFKIDVQQHGDRFTFWAWTRDDTGAWELAASGIRLTHSAALESAHARASLYLLDGVKS